MRRWGLERKRERVRRVKRVWGEKKEATGKEDARVRRELDKKGGLLSEEGQDERIRK